MASIKELTGGTGDVNPQSLTVTVTQTGVDTDTTVEVPLPIPRTPSKTANRTTIIEVLRVTFGWNQTVSSQSQRLFATVSTSPNSVDASDSQVFSWHKWETDEATTVGFQFREDPATDRLDDGAGHGFLVGTDSLSLSLESIATTQANVVFFKIFYRYKEVSLAEYIGIVQSQQ